MSREDLLAVRIRQLEGRAEDIAEAVQQQRKGRLRNIQQFDRKH